MKEQQGQLIKLRLKQDLMDDFRKELNLAKDELEQKAQNKELIRLKKIIMSDYVELKTFTQLQQTVGGKAEWMDVNDALITLSKHSESVKDHEERLDSLFKDFDLFKS